MKQGVNSAERRKNKRFQLRLAVVFSWRGPKGIIQSGDGWTRNLGSSGMYATTHIAPPLGSLMEMNVFLPELGYAIRTAEIHAVGQVVRVDRGIGNNVCGFAAVIHSITIREAVAGSRFGSRKSGRGYPSRVA
jgi:hypothetical protein